MEKSYWVFVGGTRVTGTGRALYICVRVKGNCVLADIFVQYNNTIYIHKQAKQN